MHWLVLGIISLTFFLSPYQRGLFFSEDIYMISVILTLIVSIWLLFSIFSKNDRFSGGYLFVFLLPLIYYLTFFVAESPKSNFDALFRWMAYSSFFVLLVWVRKEKQVEQILPYLFQLCGLIISFFALFGLWGWVEYRDLLLGNRLTGPFQYPNTFAAVIAAFWLYSLVVLTKKKLKNHIAVLFSLTLVAYGVSFFHTFSRGALVVFPIAWLIGLVCLRMREQGLYLCYSILSTVSSFIVFQVMIEQEELEVNTPGFGMFVIVSVIVVSLALLINKLDKWSVWTTLQERISNKALIRFLLPVAILIIGLLFILDIGNKGFVYKQLPESLQERVVNITTESTSALGRTNMYTDAWVMSKDAPLLGLGGDGWRVLFTQYQSLPYWSTQVHNGYLQILLDTGWLGLLLFVLVFFLLLGQIIFRALGERAGDYQQLTLAVFPALAMLFLHSALDFNFSYGMVWFVIMWLLAMGVPNQKGVVRSLGQILYSANSPFLNKAVVLGKSILTVMLIISMVYAYRFHIAYTDAARVANNSDAFEAAQAYQSVVDKNPYHTGYSLNLSRILATIYAHTQEEKYKQQVVDVLNRTEKLEPHNPELLYNIGQLYGTIGDYEQQREYVQRALSYDRFNVKFYDTSIQIKAQLAEWKWVQEREQESAKKWALGALADYESYQEWYLEWKDLLIPDRRPIAIQKETRIKVAELYAELGHYVEGLEALKAANANINKSIYTEEDGIIVKAEPYQVLRLSDYVKSNSDKIIVLSVRDEGSNNLSNESKEFFENIGSKISELKYRGSFLAVIVDGKIVLEKVDNNNAIEISNDTAPSLNEHFLNRQFNLLSAGKKYGDRSSIIVDGTEYSLNLLGINIAVFDKRMNFVEKINFNTYQSDINVIPFRVAD